MKPNERDNVKHHTDRLLRSLRTPLLPGVDLDRLFEDMKRLEAKGAFDLDD